jgi:hypothetical protein
MPPKKRKSKSNQQKKEAIRKRCVAEAKKQCQERDGYRCRYCGIGRPQRMTHSHHIFSEGLNKAMSADVDNLITLCWLHHLGGLKFVNTRVFSFHGHPADATEWIKKELGEKYEELKQRSLVKKALTIQFWEDKGESLKNIQ